MTKAENKYKPRGRGFRSAAKLLEREIRSAGESRGFAVSKVLTQWPEIVGAQTASICRPVKVSYAKGGFGATLTVLTTGANAPLLQADLPRIQERVNAAYGYAAIARIRLTQTAAQGFADGQAQFSPPQRAEPSPPPPEIRAKAADVADGVADDSLKLALERLATNILTKHR